MYKLLKRLLISMICLGVLVAVNGSVRTVAADAPDAPTVFCTGHCLGMDVQTPNPAVSGTSVVEFWLEGTALDVSGWQVRIQFDPTVVSIPGGATNTGGPCGFPQFLNQTAANNFNWLNSSFTGNCANVNLRLGTQTFTCIANGNAALTYLIGPADTLISSNGGANNTTPATVENGALTCGVANAAPIARDDTYSVLVGGTLNVTAPGVLANDDDADLQPLTAVNPSAVSGGVMNSFNADGSFNYTAPGVAGVHTFTYQANDGIGNSAAATVTIYVNDAHYLDMNPVSAFGVNAPNSTVNMPIPNGGSQVVEFWLRGTAMDVSGWQVRIQYDPAVVSIPGGATNTGGPCGFPQFLNQTAANNFNWLNSSFTGNCANVDLMLGQQTFTCIVGDGSIAAITYLIGPADTLISSNGGVNNTTPTSMVQGQITCLTPLAVTMSGSGTSAATSNILWTIAGMLLLSVATLGVMVSRRRENMI